MKRFLQLVKQAAVEAIEARKPCDVMFAKVVNLNPITLMLENSINLPETLLIFAGDVKRSLFIGSKVVLIRKSGGQQYLVMGVVA